MPDQAQTVVNPPDLGPLYDRMTRMEVTLDAIAEDVAETKQQATETNGKVAELKADQIRREAFRDLIFTVGRWVFGVGASLAVIWMALMLGLR